MRTEIEQYATAGCAVALPLGHCVEHHRLAERRLHRSDASDRSSLEKGACLLEQRMVTAIEAEHDFDTRACSGVGDTCAVGGRCCKRFLQVHVLSSGARRNNELGMKMSRAAYDHRIDVAPRKQLIVACVHRDFREALSSISCRRIRIRRRYQGCTTHVTRNPEMYPIRNVTAPDYAEPDCAIFFQMLLPVVQDYIRAAPGV
jgi:hypothetical protein